MRHNYNKLRQLSTGVQKRQSVIRSLLTSLVENGRIETTPKRAKVTKYEMDKLFSKLVRMYNNYEDKKDANREIIREVKKVFFTEVAGKKVVSELLPKYLDEKRDSGFVRFYRTGVRQGDGVTKILLELV